MADTVDAKSVKGNPMVQRGNNQRIPYVGIFSNQAKLTFHEKRIYFELRTLRR